MLTSNKKTKIIAVIVVIVILLWVIVPSKYMTSLLEGIYKEDEMNNIPYIVDMTLKEALKYGDEESTGENVRIVKKALGSGYKYDIDLNQIVDDILETLNTHEGSVEVYFTPKNKKEYLKKMIKAELVTQYPNLGGEAPAESFQGAINFYRYKVDGTEQKLEYIELGEPSDTGQSLYGLMNQGKAEVLNYFSLDEKGNLVVSIYSENRMANVSGAYSTEYVESGEVDYYDEDIQKRPDINTAEPEIKYSAKKINYKSLISNYIMPFEYLWAFMVCGEVEDEEFVSELADLVLGNDEKEIDPSQIDIGIYDSLTTTENITINAYNDNTWQRSGSVTREIDTGEIDEYNIYWYSSWANYQRNVNTQHNYDIVFSQRKDNTITHLAIVYLDIWYMWTPERMKYEQEPVQPTNANFEERETTWKPESDGEFKDPSYPYYDVPLIYLGDWTEISPTREQGTVMQRQNMQNQHSTSFAENKVVSKYRVQGTPEVKEKTDKKARKGDADYPNFCTIFLNTSKRDNIIGAEKWLFLILENNETTVDMVDLTKYLLYCATGVDWGVKEGKYLFSLHSPIDLTSVTGVYGDIDVHDMSLFPEDREQFLEGLQGMPEYTDNELFNEYAQYYIQYQDEFQVNAFFAVAVAIKETSGGKTGHASDGCNNIYHIRGSSHDGFASYSSKQQSVRSFYRLIAEAGPYYTAGRYTIHDIGHTYCPNGPEYPTQGDDWVECVSGYVTRMLNAAGIKLPITGSGSFVQLEEGIMFEGLELGRPLLGNSWKVTSPANPWRLHPTLNQYRPHHGVDVARSTSWNTDICSSCRDSICRLGSRWLWKLHNN